MIGCASGGKCSLSDVKQLSSALMQMRPGCLQVDKLEHRPFLQRLGMSFRIDLHKLHKSIHPWFCLVAQRRAPKTDHNMGAGSHDLTTANQDHLPDWYGLVTSQVEYSFQDEVRVETGSSESSGVTGFECEGKERSGV